MKSLRNVLALGLVAGGITLQAQMPLVPFGQIERDTQVQQRGASNLIASTSGEGYSSSSAIPSAALVTMPRPPAITPPVVDRSFLLLNGLHLGMAMMDIGMTQHCIAEHQCQEGNPLMPSSLAGQLGVNLGLFAYSATESYYLKKHRSRAWWVLPITGAAAHSIGLASGLAH